MGDAATGAGRLAPRFEARFLRRRLVYTYEVREYAPGERLVMSTDEGPFPMETTYTWADAPSGGTRMTLRNRGGPNRLEYDFTAGSRPIGLRLTAALATSICSRSPSGLCWPQYAIQRRRARLTSTSSGP